MLKSLHLEGVGPAPKLSIDLAPRLNLLTGDNGVGKTFLLDIAWWALTGDWAGSPAWPDPKSGLVSPRIRFEAARGPVEGIFDFGGQSWYCPADFDARAPGLVLYAQVGGRFSLWDSARNDVGAYRRRHASQAPPDKAYHFSEETLWNGLQEDDRVLCEGLIRDWVSWQSQRSEAFEQLASVLKTLSPGSEEELRPGAPTRVTIKDVRDHPTLSMPYGTVPLIHASAAMKRIVGLAYGLVWAWREHVRASELLRKPVVEQVVFLVDEIESHLHPKWQRLIVPALLDVMGSLSSRVDVQILATTHAPLVLASVEPVFDEATDRLFHFCLEGEQVRIDEMAWAKQGDVLNWLVSETFGLRQGRSREAERAIEAAEALMRGDLEALPAGLQTPADIHRELSRLIPGHDPFWPRWIVSQEPSVSSAAR